MGRAAKNLIYKALALKKSAEKKLQSIGYNFAKKQASPESQARIRRNIRAESGK